MIRKKMSFAICFLILSASFLLGCSDSSDRSGSFSIEEASSGKTVSSGKKASANKTTSGKKSKSSKSDASRDNTPKVLTPEASGSQVLGNDFIIIDASHTADGYFMVQYLGDNSKVKLRVTGPEKTEYIYLLSGSDSYETFPFTCGSGNYQIQVLENAGGDMYATAYSGDVKVSIKDEFGPFLYPNQYVNFTKKSKTVTKGSQLVKDAASDLEAVEDIYCYVIGSISYDEKKAESVVYGYLPDVDKTLSSGKGICFDYASLMGAMLRSQGIPTKLQVGYSGEAYHAWISTYVKEVGWVDGIIQFDGKSWTLMDPTLAAGNNKSSVKKYIGDGSNYTLKYSY